jgi:hypothetical protein
MAYVCCECFQASVCQMIFVNNADDSSGNFQFNAADGRMWAKRKVFSDVVGIPIRYFDASIAFVTCNLSTILSNTSQRLYQPQESSVLAKHSLTASLIQSFGMDVDRAAIDFPNLYHHTFLSGNLNYDVEMPKTSLTTSIDQALKAESLKRSTDAAIQSKIKALRALNQEEKSSKHHILQLNNNHGNVEIDWDLLFVKSRNSLGRGSEDGASSDEQLGKRSKLFTKKCCLHATTVYPSRCCGPRQKRWRLPVRCRLMICSLLSLMWHLLYRSRFKKSGKCGGKTKVKSAHRARSGGHLSWRAFSHRRPWCQSNTLRRACHPSTLAEVVVDGARRLLAMLVVVCLLEASPRR